MPITTTTAKCDMGDEETVRGLVAEAMAPLPNWRLRGGVTLPTEPEQYLPLAGNEADPSLKLAAWHSGLSYFISITGGHGLYKTMHDAQTLGVRRLLSDLEQALPRLRAIVAAMPEEV